MSDIDKRATIDYSPRSQDERGPIVLNQDSLSDGIDTKREETKMGDGYPNVFSPDPEPQRVG